MLTTQEFTDKYCGGDTAKHKALRREIGKDSLIWNDVILQATFLPTLENEVQREIIKYMGYLPDQAVYVPHEPFIRALLNERLQGIIDTDEYETELNDYNDYYSAGTLGYLSGAKATLPAWQAATSKDAASKNVAPVFVSTTDLHLATSGNNALDNAGTFLTIDTLDIDGITRSSTTPDLGATEFTNSPPLPVKLISFSAMPAATAVRLAWEVAGQNHTAGYTVERSTDGHLFHVLATQPARPLQYVYSAMDEMPPVGAAWYRLKMDEQDGLVTYSPVRRVLLTVAGQDAVQLSPMPVIGTLIIRTSDPALAGTRALLMDAQGRQVLTLSINTGIQACPLDHLPSGIYILRLADGRPFKVEKR